MNSSVLEAEEVSVQPAAKPARNAAAKSSYTPYQPLFSHSLLERSGLERQRRFGSTAFSLILQSILVGVLILLPLWFVDSLPALQMVTFLAPPPPPPAPPPAAAPIKSVKVVSQVLNGQLLAPNKIPKSVKMIKEEEAPPQVMGVTGGVVGGVPGGQAGGVLGSLLNTSNRGPAPSAPEIPKRVRISTGVSLGLLEKRVEPVYPIIALRARVQGTVQLHAIISKEGHIKNLQLIEGHPMLVEAAIAAVQQWQYQPYQVSGEPVEVETTVSVNFHIDH
jgi:protein TonB